MVLNHFSLFGKTAGYALLFMILSKITPWASSVRRLYPSFLYRKIAPNLRCMSSSQYGTNILPKLSLSMDERNLFDSLRLFVRDSKLDITVRVAGGWVRDKLLAWPGNKDIDMAIDKMTGLQFVEEYNNWRVRRGEERQNYNIVKKNPEKSKHLETITVRFGSLEVDFVNLRTESYAEDSRIPQMALGTPQEDALRRDLTINSLFYNVKTNEIEDFTGHGIDDLRRKIIRTPLPPLVTLTDDPLRALRVIRFACRYRFQLDDALFDACQDLSVHEALRMKVSSSRIESELEGMMKNNEFPRAMFLLYKTRLLQNMLPLTPQFLQKYCYPASTNNNKRQELIYDYATLSILLQQYMALYPSVNLSTSSAVRSDSLLINTAQQMMSQNELIRFSSYANLVMGWKHEFVRVRSPSPAPRLVRDQLELPTKYIKDIIHVHSTIPMFKEILSQSIPLVLSSTPIASPSSSQHTKQQPHQRGHRQSNSSSFSIPFENDLDPDSLAVSCSSLVHGRKIGSVDRLALGLAVFHAGSQYREILTLSCIATVVDALPDIWARHQEKLQYSKTHESSVAANRENHVSHHDKLHHEVVARLIDQLAVRVNTLDADKYQSSNSLASNPSVDNLFLTEVLEVLDAVIQHADYLLELIQEWQLENVLFSPPLMRGEQLMEINPNSKTVGSIIKQMVDIRVRWQICNPQGSVDDLEKYFKQIYKLG